MYKFLQLLANLFRSDTKVDNVITQLPQTSPDGMPLSEGAKFRVNNSTTYGHNLPPDKLTDGVEAGRYYISEGAELELLQCEAPQGYAPYRWPVWDRGNRIGYIWVHSDDLTYVSGTLGIPAGDTPIKS